MTSLTRLALLGLACWLGLAAPTRGGGSDPEPGASGVPAIEGDGFRVDLLASGPVPREAGRRMKDLAATLRNTVRHVRSLGLPWNGRVQLLLRADDGVPARDLWATVAPKGLLELRSLLVAANRTDQAVELEQLKSEIRTTWPFLGQLPVPRKPGAGRSESEIDDYLQRLRDSMNEPAPDPSGLYSLSETAAYHPQRRVISAKLDPTELHRLENEIVHELGHHVFEGMLSDPGTRESHQALSELFADYLAVAVGRYGVLTTRHGRLIHPEEKRYFSHERTVIDFARMVHDSPLARARLIAPHVLLNPVRSLLWRCRRALGDRETDQLVVAATRLALAAPAPEAPQSIDDPEAWIVEQNGRVIGFLDQAAVAVPGYQAIRQQILP